MSEPDSGPGSVYALLADGRTVEIRPARAADFDAVKAMHEAMSPNNAYLRFFSLSRLAARAGGAAGHQGARTRSRRPARRLRRPGGRARQLRGDACQCRQAESADRGGGLRRRRHHAPQGHRDAAARASRLAGPRQPARGAGRRDAVRRTPACSGCSPTRACPCRASARKASSPSPSRCRPTTPARTSTATWTRVAVRERSANVASLRPVFAPQSVAVIGASRNPGTVGRIVPRQPPGRRLLRPALRGQPARAGDRRRPLLPRRGQPAGDARPRAARGAARGGHRDGGGLRAARRARPRGVHRGRRRAGGRRAARRLPQARDAADRPQLLRHRRPVDRARRDLRRGQARCRAASASSCSPAVSASPWWTTSPASASASPRSPRSATSSTCRATTC